MKKDSIHGIELIPNENEQNKSQKYQAELNNMNNSDEEHKDDLFKSLNSHNMKDSILTGGLTESSPNNVRAPSIQKSELNTRDSYLSSVNQTQFNRSANSQYYTENLVEKPYRVQCIELFMHIGLLLKKNFYINQRNKCVFIFHYLTPVIVCLLLVFWQGVANRLIDFLIIEPDLYEQPLIPACLSPEYLDSMDPKDNQMKGNKRGCISVGYHIIGERQLWVDEAMEYVAQTNSLEFGKDVKLLSQGDPAQYSKYIRKHLNRTQIGVVFCTTSYPLNQYGIKLDLPCNVNIQDNEYSEYIKDVQGYDWERFKHIKTMVYTIMYNGTLNYRTPYLADPKASVGKDDLVRSLKVSLDNAIIEIVSENTIESFSRVYNESIPKNEQKLNINKDRKRMQVIAQDYPKIPTRFTQGYDVFASNGAFYLFIPIMVSFILLINEMLREKEKKLRQGLTTMGLTHFSYITSWVLYTFITCALLQLIMVLSGVFFTFEFFTRSPYIVTFSILFSFSLSLMAIGYFISTICSDVKLGYTVSYAFLLFSVVMEMFMASPAFIFYLYSDDPSLFVQILLNIFSAYPAFHYSKLFHDVAQRTNKHYEIAAGRWVSGPGFEYSDIFENFSGKFPYPPTEYHTPSTLTSFLYLNLTTLFFFILGWYCDHVVSSNRGTQESPLFFLGNEYWKCLRRQQKIRRKLSDVLQKSSEIIERSGMKLDESVKQEKELVLKNQLEDAHVDGLRIQGLSKIYRKYPFGIKSRYDKKAISDIFFEIRENELVSLLGHNGAGKSTLIGVLTGLLTPSQGTAIIRGYDIRTNMGQIRQMMGVCPQFDILWDELTAYEHLEMYCKIKNVPRQFINQEIDKRMSEVRMSDKKHFRVGTFSGGQKRRISLAIAAIGDPKIIFLDEPTTGMDPKTRREVWNMIKELRVNRSVILTTHAMEEADILSDRIIVVSDGQLKAIGTPLYLKNSHGDTYRLNLIMKSDQPLDLEIARVAIKKLLPSSNSIQAEGASILIGVSSKHTSEIRKFFSVIECQNDELLQEDEKNFKNSIKEWSLSHATLEEVFLQITNNAEQFQSHKQ